MRPIDICMGDSKASFATKQANEFAEELTSKINEVSDMVADNLNSARDKMKKVYDRKNSSHTFEAGDSVMLWWPYYKPGISRSFQPRWSGPFVIEKLIGQTNCTIKLHDGSMKHVHLNQLKKVAVRNPDFCLNPVRRDKDDIRPSCSRVFEAICNEIDDDASTVYDSALEDLDYEEGGENDDAWCGLNDRNIIGARTRSGLREEGDG